MRPDIEQLKKTLRRGKGSFVPMIELGVHPAIKSRMIGRELLTLKDEVEFWHTAGYDYVKLQPVADFNPGKSGLYGHPAHEDEGMLTRNWASENSGVISNAGELERYQFPSVSDFDYSKFENVRSLLPDGMGVIGQYGDIFTMTWEMMGFETFSSAIFDHPDLVLALNQKVGELVVSMFE
ncbi:MAG TPA: nucleoside 2-deoxyribosyltransferase, partial [Bacteroidota bacterium]